MRKELWELYTEDSLEERWDRFYAARARERIAAIAKANRERIVANAKANTNTSEHTCRLPTKTLIFNHMRLAYECPLCNFMVPAEMEMKL